MRIKLQKWFTKLFFFAHLQHHGNVIIMRKELKNLKTFNSHVGALGIT